jgi:carbonic anhydrase
MELTRRSLLKTAGSAAAALALGGLMSRARSVLPGAEVATGAWNHDPDSPLGPARWGNIGFPTCGQGTSQSPVNIKTDAVARYQGSPLLLRYESSELVVENTGHVVEVPIPADVHDTLRIGRDSYELIQYHFHAPSEHAVNGQLADLEAHFVHTNPQGGTAVVGVFYRFGTDTNEVLESILLAAPATAGEEVHVGEASPAELFRNITGLKAARGGPDRVDSFFTYDGSLTTPGCTENVRWSVVANGGHVSTTAVARLHEVIKGFPDYDGYPNHRPVQSLTDE